jgi:hypothetical protein
VRAETIYAFAMTGLRALAEYDPIEFTRSTDLSKRHLDDRIASLIQELRDEPEFDELQRQTSQLNSVERDSESPVAAAFLLRQISQTCLQRAQALAIGYRRTTGPSDRARILPERVPAPQGQAFSGHEEYLRLGVMRLLRDLPEYTTLFNYRWRDYEIDCVLQPINDGAPPVLIEIKTRIQSVQQAREAFRKLHRVGAGWDKSTLFGLLTIKLDQEILQSIG